MSIPFEAAAGEKPVAAQTRDLAPLVEGMTVWWFDANGRLLAGTVDRVYPFGSPYSWLAGIAGNGRQLLSRWDVFAGRDAALAERRLHAINRREYHDRMADQASAELSALSALENAAPQPQPQGGAA